MTRPAEYKSAESPNDEAEKHLNRWRANQSYTNSSRSQNIVGSHLWDPAMSTNVFGYSQANRYGEQNAENLRIVTRGCETSEAPDNTTTRQRQNENK